MKEESGNKYSKLTEEQILNIRWKYANEKTSYPKLAKEYGVVTSLIAMIVKRQIWKHI